MAARGGIIFEEDTQDDGILLEPADCGCEEVTPVTPLPPCELLAAIPRGPLGVLAKTVQIEHEVPINGVGGDGLDNTDQTNLAGILEDFDNVLTEHDDHITELEKFPAIISGELEDEDEFALYFDEAPTEDSTKLVNSGGIWTTLERLKEYVDGHKWTADIEWPFLVLLPRLEDIINPEDQVPANTVVVPIRKHAVGAIPAGTMGITLPNSTSVFYDARTNMFPIKLSFATPLRRISDPASGSTVASHECDYRLVVLVRNDVPTLSYPSNVFTEDGQPIQLEQNRICVLEFFRVAPEYSPGWVRCKYSSYVFNEGTGEPEPDPKDGSTGTGRYDRAGLLYWFDAWNNVANGTPATSSRAWKCMVSGHGAFWSGTTNANRWDFSGNKHAAACRGSDAYGWGSESLLRLASATNPVLMIMFKRTETALGDRGILYCKRRAAGERDVAFVVNHNSRDNFRYATFATKLEYGSEGSRTWNEFDNWESMGQPGNAQDTKIRVLIYDASTGYSYIFVLTSSEANALVAQQSTQSNTARLGSGMQLAVQWGALQGEIYSVRVWERGNTSIGSMLTRLKKIARMDYNRLIEGAALPNPPTNIDMYEVNSPYWVSLQPPVDPPDESESAVPYVVPIAAGADTITGTGIASSLITLIYPDNPPTMRTTVVDEYLSTWSIPTPVGVTLVAGDIVKVYQQEQDKVNSEVVEITVGDAP